ncbi:hypothetical protein SELMODRAFT_85994 [Selaginella moellendorffii]|uniref:DoxX family protein n=2 Tax=Selaginella moellendorffii TaxID=88036 RepID=D8R6S6_SELML|nr:uncharacterized protein LOC9652521 [Selaginella moellendorffii]EFJ20699.1 hypothetical protein SELMODRAFT_108343 [Selaginella moellendorffii]EFJ32725.1 hypothetical protein SELMODRAFT_85994 [Selaginella moellendorffii]|eukprot:XP_002966698.1 uncharacterized protein LOC9652521 [Selaginella moellendorffii]
MGFMSFAGRVFFSAIFILSAWQKISEFGSDGGLSLKTLEPKFALFKQHVSSTLHFEIPGVNLKYLLMAAIAAEGLGAILFTCGSTIGAYLLMIFIATVTPIMHDFYNYELSNPAYVREFMQFLKNLSIFGALLFYLGMVNSQRLKKKSIKSKTN